MILILLCVLCIILYYYGTKNHDYWKNRGVKYEKPLIFFGGNFKHMSMKLSISERYVELYKQYPHEKYIGLFNGNKPVLLMRDPGLIKQVLSADFGNFHHRGINPSSDSIEPIMKGVFFVEGDIWKIMRQKITPAFSSAKLKAMFPLIVERARKVETVIEEVANTDQYVDVRELMAKYATDFIAACGFGINTESYDDMVEFRELGKRIVTKSLRDTVIILLKMTAPDLFKNFYIFAPEIERKTMFITRQIMSQRDYKPSGRNDFIDFMLELKQKGNIVGESIEKRNLDGSAAKVELELDDLLIMAQIFVFFVAGFETSSSASSFLLHELAYHQDIQSKCHKEIDEVLSKYDGKMCYEAVKEMKYLEACFKESMRILPSPGFLTRKSTSTYTFADTNLTIDKGTGILISMQALHMDEKYFPEPEEFRPERFYGDNAKNIEKYAYLPFGEGPRACIGERMGIMQSLAGVATILRKYTVLPSTKSVKTPIIDYKTSFVVQNILGGLPLTFKRRKTY